MLQQHYANCLVNETKKNCHSFPNQTAENYSLIYNWNANPDYALYFFQTVNQAWIQVNPRVNQHGPDSIIFPRIRR